MVIHLDDFGSECQEGGILQPSFHVRISINLIGQRLAGDPSNLAISHPSEDLLYGFGLPADSKLCLIISEAVQTARVEVNFHAVSRLSRISPRSSFSLLVIIPDYGRGQSAGPSGHLCEIISPRDAGH
jgi:hypothetical protein